MMIISFYLWQPFEIVQKYNSFCCQMLSAKVASSCLICFRLTRMIRRDRYYVIHVLATRDNSKLTQIDVQICSNLKIAALFMTNGSNDVIFDTYFCQCMCIFSKLINLKSPMLTGTNQSHRNSPTANGIAGLSTDRLIATLFLNTYWCNYI